MFLRRSIASVFLTAVAALSPAFARELTGDEKASLQQSVNALEVAVRSWDMAAIANNMAPRIVAMAAKRAGITDQQYVAGFIDDAAHRAHPHVDLFSMNLSVADYKTTPNGTPYVLIPTETVFSLAQGKIDSHETTLGMLVGGRWHLLRVDDETFFAELRQAYPEFADVAVPAGTLESVKQ